MQAEKKLLQCLIDSIDVYVEKVIEIKWRFRDDTLEEPAAIC